MLRPCRWRDYATIQKEKLLIPICMEKSWKNSLEMRIFWHEELLARIQFFSERILELLLRQEMSTDPLYLLLHGGEKRLWNCQLSNFCQYAGKSWNKLSRDAHISTRRTSWIISTFSEQKPELLFRQEMSKDPWYLLLHGGKKAFVELSTSPIVANIQRKTLKKTL